LQPLFYDANVNSNTNLAKANIVMPPQRVEGVEEAARAA